MSETTTSALDVEIPETALSVYAPPPPPTLFGTDDPDVVVERAARVASVLADVIRKRKLFASIQGKEYVLAEGWTLLATMLGVDVDVVYSDYISEPTEGYEARVEARIRGRVIGSGEAMCTRDERRWAHADWNAIRSMAQTRATAKALRQRLGFVMTLAGYAPTPAEEITQSEGSSNLSAKNLEALKTALAIVGDDPIWSHGNVLKMASVKYGRKIATLPELTDYEAEEIMIGVRAYVEGEGEDEVASTEEKEETSTKRSTSKS